MLFLLVLTFFSLASAAILPLAGDYQFRGPFVSNGCSDSVALGLSDAHCYVKVRNVKESGLVMAFTKECSFAINETFVFADHISNSYVFGMFDHNSHNGTQIALKQNTPYESSVQLNQYVNGALNCYFGAYLVYVY